MARSPGDQNVTQAERLRIRVLYAAGMPLEEIPTVVGRNLRSIQRVVAASGGLPPRMAARSALRLSFAEREEISRGCWPASRTGPSRVDWDGRPRR